MLGLLLFLNMLNPNPPAKQIDVLHDLQILHLEKLNVAGPGCRKKSDGPELCGCGPCFVCDFTSCTCRAIPGCTL